MEDYGTIILLCDFPVAGFVVFGFLFFSNGKFCIVEEVNNDMGVSAAVVKEREESDTCMAIVVISKVPWR